MPLQLVHVGIVFMGLLQSQNIQPKVLSYMRLQGRVRAKAWPGDGLKQAIFPGHFGRAGTGLKLPRVRAFAPESSARLLGPGDDIAAGRRGRLVGEEVAAVCSCSFLASPHPQSARCGK